MLGLARTTTLALALAALALMATPAFAAIPTTGKWAGKTAQKKKLSFRIAGEGDRVKGLKIRVRFKCEEGEVTVTRTVGAFSVKPSGRFGGTAENESGDTLSLTGRFRSTGRARGRFRFVEESLVRGQCDSGVVRWSAKLR